MTFERHPGCSIVKALMSIDKSTTYWELPLGIAHAVSSTRLSECRRCYHSDMKVQSKYLCLPTCCSYSCCFPSTNLWELDYTMRCILITHVMSPLTDTSAVGTGSNARGKQDGICLLTYASQRPTHKVLVDCFFLYANAQNGYDVDGAMHTPKV